jgi:hypothetical protein
VGAEVQRVWVSSNFAEIFQYGQAPSYQFIQAKLFGDPNFHDAVYRRTYYNPDQGTRDVVSSDRLVEHWCQTNLVARQKGDVGKALEKLEKLCRLDD